MRILKKLIFFLRIVWRWSTNHLPEDLAHGLIGCWWQYKIEIATAWKVAGILFDD